MYTDTLIQLGLAQNEARIYETLLREGESSVGDIATKSGVHRRNVYDSLNRLLEKGLVFEILERRENRYQAVDPGKLSEMLQEKQRALAGIMPSLESLYSGTPHRNDVFIYKGVECWKNYIR
ncbi:MAG TPA: helix-turn-helix domain-containing protein, partial [Patescibacteria group bacterium]